LLIERKVQEIEGEKDRKKREEMRRKGPCDKGSFFFL
jgi:hypothetical protein